MNQKRWITILGYRTNNGLIGPRFALRSLVAMLLVAIAVWFGWGFNLGEMVRSREFWRSMASLLPSELG